ncbi:MAG: NUDIX hydrolase [Brachybacterium sp.]|nr:NUDIX hydrolase [Brachybacterium sp.]
MDVPRTRTAEMAEIWDLTDADGVPLGRTHRRGQPLPAGTFHLVPTVCVLREDGMVLLTLRASHKPEGDLWEFPGGSALAGESARDGARRELREETGLDLPDTAFTHIGRIQEREALLDLFLGRVGPDATVVPDPTEVADHAWIALEDVRRVIADGRMAPSWIPRLDRLGAALLAEIRVG